MRDLINIVDEGMIAERRNIPEMSVEEKHEVLKFVNRWLRGDFMSDHGSTEPMVMWKKIASWFPPKVSGNVTLYRLITVPIAYADKPQFNIHPAPGKISSWTSSKQGLDPVAGVANELVPHGKIASTARIAISAQVPASDILATYTTIKELFYAFAGDYFDRYPEQRTEIPRDDGRVQYTYSNPGYPGGDDQDFTMDDVGFYLDVLKRRGGHYKQFEVIVVSPPSVQATLVRVYRKGEKELRAGNDDPHN